MYIFFEGTLIPFLGKGREGDFLRLVSVFYFLSFHFFSCFGMHAIDIWRVENGKMRD